LRDTKASPGSEEQAGAELWLTEGNGALPEFTPEPIEVNPDDSAELIHDEVGMFVPEVDESEDQLLESDFVESLAVVEATPPGPMLAESDALAAALQAIAMAMSGSSSTLPGTGSQRAFIDALAKLQHKPTQGHEEYHLDTLLLSNLNASEMAVLAVAEQRKFSPSDQALLADLGVKRSRLSQICSRLLKGGVLNARTSGRQRFYTMTSTARAQLAAWGVQGGEA
jgi:DNA-binding MarR family transcriptional regulator